MRAEELITDVEWLRGLARRLVRDDAAADDLVQETWEVATRKPPEARDSRRPWLRKVLRDLWLMRLRGERRRVAREEAMRDLAGEVPSPEQLVARAETSRLLAELVLRLDEPYRGTVLLHFHEGLSAADIARAQGIPAGTVRWRLKVALDEVRAALDARSGARREWAVALLQFSGGIVTVARHARPIGLSIGLILLLLGGALVGASWLRGGNGGGGDHAPETSPSSAPPVVRTAATAVPAEPDERAAHRPATRVVTGRVFGEKGPLAGAQLWLADATAQLRAVSDGGGRFRFEAPPRPFALIGAADGYVTTQQTVDARRDETVDLYLIPCRARLYGTISDAAGTPLPGATVELASALAPASGAGAVTADARGRYELCAFHRGTTALTVRAPGYGTMRTDFVAHARHRLDLTLVPEGVVVGRVAARDGTPLPGARVVLEPVDNRQQGAEPLNAVAGDEGAFQIDAAAPGAYRVVAWDDDHLLVDKVELTVEAAATAAPLDLRLDPGARLEGTVLADGKPLAGVRVAADSPVRYARGHSYENRHGSGVTAEDGSFVLRRLVPENSYVIEVEGREVVTPRNPFVADPSSPPVTVEVKPAATVAGTVRTAGGAPARGAAVFAAGLGVVTTRADADGHYELSGVNERQLLSARALDGSAVSTSVQLRVAAGQRQDGVDLVLTRAATISGVVVDDRGRPVEGAEVNAGGPSGTVDLAMAVTTESGRFELGPLGGGVEYKIIVRPFRNAWTELTPPGADAFPPVALADAGSRVTDLRLVVDLAGGLLEGVVIDQYGLPLADVAVSASPERTPGQALELLARTPWPTARTGTDGRFVLSVRGAPTYTVEARPVRALAARVAGVAAGTRNVELRVPAAGAIVGVARGLGDDARVAAWGAGDGEPHHARLERGAFRFEELPAGKYELSASDRAGNHATATAEVRSGALERVELDGAPPGSVRGQVLMPDGTPAADVPCTLVPSAEDRTSYLDRRTIAVRTDAAGRFSVARVPTGKAWATCGDEPSAGWGGGGGAAVESGREAEMQFKVYRRDQR